MNDVDNTLNLEQLTTPDIDFATLAKGVGDEIVRIENECKEKYGDNWWEHFVAHTSNKPDYDWEAKVINDAIYHGRFVIVTGDFSFRSHMRKRYMERMEELFGKDYELFLRHSPNDPKINKILLEDARKTKKWKELPAVLHNAYHKLAND